MPLTTAQITKLGQNRKQNPPSYFNAETGQSQSIRGETEDALILIGSDVKQKAAQYLDLLLNANPAQNDYDAITARAATKQIDNLTAALSELEPVISNFATFKDQLLGDSSTELIFVDGLVPLLTSLLYGIGRMRNRIDALKFTKKVNTFSAVLYSSNLTDDQRKEWRSWKRVLLAYP